MKCNKDCKRCTRKPKMVTQTKWCYDESFGLPPMIVTAQRFTSVPGAGQERTASLEDYLERNKL